MTINASVVGCVSSSSDMTGECVGTTVPPVGSVYDPSVVMYAPDVTGPILLTGEGIGTDPSHENVLVQSYHYGAGAKYGPQPVISGGGGGGGGSEYIHLQNSPLSVWTISHNLGFRPDVYLTTIGGVEVMGGEVVHVNNNILTIEFDIPFSGYARLT